MPVVSYLRETAKGKPRTLRAKILQEADRIERLESVNAKLVEALEELYELVEAAREGEYCIDSFTTQPARAALALAKGKEQ